MKKDKIKHIYCGVATALAVGLITYQITGDNGFYNVAAGIYSALAGGFVAAAVKEWCDTNYCLDISYWDWKDIGFTMLGAAAVALGIVLMHYVKG